MNIKLQNKVKIALLLLITLISVLCFMSYSIETETIKASTVAVSNMNIENEETLRCESSNINQRIQNRIDSETLKNLRLIPGGMPFGMSMKTEGIIVSATSDVDTDKGNISPSRQAGIKCGDVITALDSNPVESSDMLYDSIVNCDGMPIKLTILRDGKIYEINVNPAFSKSEKEWRLGLWIKDSAKGIGTVTFLNPINSTFAGLGHAICDTDSGIIMPFRCGKIFNALVSGVKQSVPGSPGELHGTLTSENGIMSGNTFVGVYGKYGNFETENKPVPVAAKNEIESGKANILCTLYGTSPEEYEICITSLSSGEDGYRDMTIEITDSKLLSLTGGIVQGMSGSPIIQNGKIIGAVTHVLIDNPKMGYGVYAENMLSEMSEIYS